MNNIDERLDQESKRLYNNLLTLGLDIFIDEFSEMGFRRAISHLENLISHFESKEEFEKCTTLNEFLILTIAKQTEHFKPQIKNRNN